MGCCGFIMEITYTYFWFGIRFGGMVKVQGYGRVVHMILRPEWNLM